MHNSIIMYKILVLVICHQLYVNGAEDGFKYHVNLSNVSDLHNIDLTKINAYNLRDSTRIINGYPAQKYFLPYQAAIYVLGQSNEALFCGGAVISNNYVITAAHCVFEPPARIIIILGNENLQAYSPYEIRVDVDLYTIHDRFDGVSLKNDICLLHLQHPIAYNNAVRPISLPSFNDIRQSYLDMSGIVSGYGKMYDYGRISTRLMYVRVEVMDNFVCNRMFSGKEGEYTNICTSGNERTGACQGDSGGPLAINNKLVGVVSYGGYYCNLGYPTVYTRIPTYLSWIAHNSDVQINKY